MTQNGNRKLQGFSLVEFLIAISIGVAFIILITFFAREVFSTNFLAQASLTAQLESRKILKSIVADLRSTSPSALGAYPIETAGTSSIIFFADVNSDDVADRIRLYLDTPTRALKRGVVLATGAPPSYNLGSETITTLISNIVNSTSTPLFDYYDGNYSGTSTALTYPLNLALVRLVRVTIHIDKDPARPPAAQIFISGAALRNLKDNL